MNQVRRVRIGIICPVCDTKFDGSNTRIYCSFKCAASKQNRKSATMPDNLSTGTKGKIVEMVIANHLLLNGWSVFTNCSPNGSSDLIAFKADHEPRFIECRAGVIGSEGQFCFNLKIHDGSPRPTHYGVYFHETGEVHFFPVEPKMKANLDHSNES